MLEALSVEFADLEVLVLENLQTPCQRIGDLELFTLGLVLVLGLVVIEGSFHLFDGGYDGFGLTDHVILLSSNEAHLVMEGF